MSVSRLNFRLDPRVKLLCVIIANLLVFSIASLFYEILLVSLFGIFLLLDKKFSAFLKFILSYIVLLLLYLYALPLTDNMLALVVAIPVSHLRRMYPMVMAAVLFLATTTSRELMSGMHKMHCPKAITIPMSITIRYFPAFREDFKNIKDAMKLRRVRGFNQIKCVYMPLLFSASKISDEITEAAITRGIENPCKKTCIDSFSMKIIDYVCIAVLIALTVSALVIDVNIV